LPKVKLPLTTPNRQPPRTPMKSDQTARQGIMTAMARNFGTTRNATGSRAMVSSASSSSVTRIVPISAAKAEPDRPMTTIAVISGPSSRVMEMDTRLATNCMAPRRCNWYAPCNAMMTPTKKVIRDTDGFQQKNGALFDKAGNAVEFSIVTNAGSKPRERMAVMVQEDLSKLGIKVNVVTLDFPSLIEQISQKFNYEAAVLGFRNVELDPNSQMTIWLSSADNHAWNPAQKTPATTWEAEIDRLMHAQASTVDPKKLKESFDRVQEIVYEQAPIIYLVNQNALSAVSNAVAGANPGILHPQTFWNAEYLTLNPTTRASR